MAPHNSPPTLPPKFLRTALESSFMVRSFCNSCSSEVARSASPDVLDISEKLGLRFALLQKPFPTESLIAAVQSAQYAP
jgi:hypothetical protein